MANVAAVHDEDIVEEVGSAPVSVAKRKTIAFVYMNSEANIGRGAGYVAAAVREAGHEVHFYDTLYTPVEAVADDVVREGVDVLMISSMTMIFTEALKLIRLVKSRVEIPVLLGGIHPTLEKEKILRDHPEIDFVCVGEGETMVLDFLDRFQSGDYASISNLLYRVGDKIHGNQLAPATDLATLAPFPWDWFPRDAVVLPETRFCYVTASRGCPYSCTYCCNVVYLKAYKKSYLRTRPVDDVIEELKYLKKNHDPWLFYFADEMLLFDLDYVRELFTRFRKEIGGRFGLQGRVEYLDDETVAYLAKCGCRYVAMGAECGDEEFCKTVLRRKISNQMLEDAVKRLKSHGIFVTTFNMIGYPVENDDFLTLQTIRFSARLKPDYTQISVFYPFPGTVLGKKAVDEGWVDQDRMETITDYYSQSVLKDKEYVTELRDELAGLFNPKPFPDLKMFERRERYRAYRTAWLRARAALRGSGARQVRAALRKAWLRVRRGVSALALLARRVPILRTVGRAVLRSPGVGGVLARML